MYGIIRRISKFKSLQKWWTPATVTKTSSHYIANGNIQDNIILIGSPGSGKTTVGRLLGPKLGMDVLDVDDHHLEPYWGMSVAEKLEEVGSNSFIEVEGKALLEFNERGKVISLTGSNPMYKPAMDHVAKTGTVVFLDTPSHDIVKRLEEMKVNRIVGQTGGMSMESLLKYRQQFYEGSYDIRVIVEENETPESITNKIFLALSRMKTKPGYVSTRQNAKLEHRMSFSDVILKGLAPDGGLYVPAACLSVFSTGEMKRMVDTEYNQRALRILEKCIHPSDLHPSLLSRFLSTAYSSDNFGCSKIFPVRHLHDNQYLLELFHGPTASFKDAALQLMPQFFVESLKVSNTTSKYAIIVATSGDTGGAVLDGFTRHAGDANVGVLVLYPDEGISDVQKHQMTSMAGRNIKVTGVRGDFDACQSFVKRAFNDHSLQKDLIDNLNCKLSAANSISWGRLLPQVVYHVSSYLDLVQNGVVKLGKEVDLCIPTGNFGNILAAYYSKQMGVPYRRLICASNANNILTDFIKTGTYDLRNRKLHKTTSPAIDILVSSNLERYLYHLSGGSAEFISDCFKQLESSKHFSIPGKMLSAMNELFVADWCSEEEAKKTIKSTLDKTGYLMDPHTAVAKAVGDRFNNNECPMVIASTAHYAKFGPDVASFLGLDIPNEQPNEVFEKLQEMCTSPVMHLPLQESIKWPSIHTTVLNSKYSEVREEIKNFARTI
ncbi:threonine synthase-like 1 isoform X2 [Pecten maximus]|uniref:threonine synthase-like 1 isoform X1 n=1 Tax=Pecten maximus TaxID=6579 RepID=UPI001458F836|nr:threonine synthase-like 1 isoform X1 [Pecten maximus]XP_033746550.1 threonine synthase-like 1 isoform X2 [Pecten maximus]